MDIAAGIGDMIDDVELESGQIQFSMLADNTWWHSQEIKFATIESLREGAASRLANVLHAQALSDALLERIATTTSANTRLIETISRQQEKAREGFNNQRNKIADLAKPLAFIAIDLDTMVGNLPFILAAFIAGALFWRSLAEREFASAYRLIAGGASAGNDHPAVLKPEDAKSQTSFAKQVFVFGSVWVVIASAQLGFSQTLSTFEAVLVGALGIAVILIASWNHIRTVD